MLRKLAVEKELQSKIDKLGVIKRYKRTGKFPREFFFPSKVGHISQTSKLPTSEIKPQKTVGRLGGLIRRNAASIFSQVYRAKIRRRRYVKHGSQWFHDTITWNIPANGWSTKLTHDEVNTTLIKAFRLWAEVSPLKFRWLDPPASVDITVKFATGMKEGIITFFGKNILSTSLFTCLQLTTPSVLKIFLLFQLFVLIYSNLCHKEDEVCQRLIQEKEEKSTLFLY